MTTSGSSLSQNLARILILAVVLLGCRFASAQTPEYLTSETPIPANLEETLTPTEGIGALSEEDELERLVMPRDVFPAIREFIPNWGIPFIDDTVYLVSPRVYYRHLDQGDGTVAEALTYGGSIGVKTGALADTLRFGFTGYTSQKIHAPSDRGGTGLLKPGQGAYWALGEAYAEIQFKGIHSKLFRQRLDLPYINASDSRMTPNTFEAYGMSLTDIPNLQAGIGHIQRIKFRTSTDFVPLSVRAGAADSNLGVTAFGGRYTFSEDTSIGFAEEYGWDTFNVFYLEADHLLQITDELDLRTGLQFTDQRSVGAKLAGEFNAQHFGYKLAFGYHNLIVAGSYTRTSEGNGIRKPWGGSPSYNSVMLSDFDRAGEQAVRTAISYDFSNLGLNGFAASATWLYGDTPDTGSNASPDQQEFNVNFDYRPTIAGLDKIWLRVRYALNDRDAALGGLDRKDLRIILNYSFSF